MKQILLPSFPHLTALCDTEDYPVLSRFTWGWDGRYPTTSIGSKKIYFHQLVMPRTGGHMSKLVVDHINGNTLDNRKENLRWASKSQNGQNQSQKDFIGVSFDRRRKKYRAYCTVNGVWKYLGYHDTQEQAALAYNEEMSKYSGRIKLNKVP